MTRGMKAFRYDGEGRLREAPNHGPSFREAVPEEPEALAAALTEPFPWERRIDYGLFALDLAREERASGVPAWYRPNASRRKRRGTWAALTTAERKAWAPPLFGPKAERELRGYPFGRRFAFAGALPGQGIDVTALLYLPAEDKPSRAQAADMDRELLAMARAEAERRYLARPAAPAPRLYRLADERSDLIRGNLRGELTPGSDTPWRLAPEPDGMLGRSFIFRARPGKRRLDEGKKERVASGPRYFDGDQLPYYRMDVWDPEASRWEGGAHARADELHPLPEEGGGR